MYYQETFTFKTRRKSDVLLISLLFVASFVTRTLAGNHQVCPDNCECYVDSRYEYTLHTAECDHLVWKKTYFLNIVQLKMKLASYADQCRLPNVTAKMFPKLQRLDMSNCSLTSIPSSGINDFKNLLSLDLSNNLIQDVPSKATLSYRQLQHLTLDNNPLNSQSTLAIESTSLYELNMNSCGIKNVSSSTFAGVPNLKYLSLSNNSISELRGNTFPEGLRTIDLSRNKIVNVLTSEFLRLTNLAQLNLSKNPVNCTCPLIAFQDWMSGKGVFFVDSVTCGYPRKYVGRNLNRISEWDMCDSKVLEDSSSSKEKCAPNQICNNGVVTEDGYQKDENKDALEQDEVMPVGDKEALVVEDMVHTEQLDGSGDGDGESTDSPSQSSKSVQSTTSTATITPSAETTSQSTTDTASPSSGGVVRVEHELTSSSETPDTGRTTTTETPTTTPVAESVQPSPENETIVSKSNGTDTEVVQPDEDKRREELPAVAETVQPSTESETVVSESNDTNTEALQPDKDKGRREMFGYVIPGVAVLLVGCVCLAVYCSQCASKVDSYKPTETNVEGAELQEVSLLSDNNHATIVKLSNKYPGEKENGQTERLMNEHERTNGGSNITAEVNGNGSQHSDDTIDCCKLSNGQSTTNQTTQGNMECTVVRVTTLPDSVPKTAVIRDL